METAIHKHQPHESQLKTDQMFINLGPQHPSTHGVLRVGLTVEGEVIVKADPDVGYLHRGTEKLAEIRGYHHCVVISDRWDYISAMTNNLVFCLAAEKLMNVEVPERGNHLRVIMCELNRISSHLLFFGTFGIDMGAFTAFLHAFRERELILDLFEAACGARMTFNYIRLGGVMKDVSPQWIAKTREFLEYFKPRLDEYDQLLSFNPIFLDRTKTIGKITAKQAVDWGLSGPNLRASGVDYDARRFAPHCGYEKYSFEVPLGQDGTCWDRYYCRVREMRESVKIVEQALSMMKEGDINGKGVAKIPKPPPGESYAHIEGARGNVGIHLVSDGGIAPFRMHVKAPSFINLAILQEVLINQRLADVIAILGSIDIVLGEVDR
ncbi:MAG TPA: NADH-quinone oxidoreductase subunit D [Elusimicrobiota bacterium]|jgi:NADH-quinone oxidoreductase subunit D|nr:NADH-quinone oxidoreductase subunit D [Elusimicrobiota bacterium]